MKKWSRMNIVALALAASTVLDVRAQTGESYSAADFLLMGRALTDTMVRHLVMSPHRPRSPAEDDRAMAFARRLRAAVWRLSDTAAARRAGYKLSPPFPGQRLSHYVNSRNLIDELDPHGQIDPTRPSALVFKTDSGGSVRLIGAMFMASEDLTFEQLDRRIPLSVGHWHRHANLCYPKDGNQARWRDTLERHPLFGTDSHISTRAECEAVGGVFTDLNGPWMIHAYPFDGDAVDAVWGDQHDVEGQHGVRNRGASPGTPRTNVTKPLSVR